MISLLREKIKRRHFLAVLSSVGLLGATRSDAQSDSKLLLVGFFNDAQLQIETDNQRAELSKALGDLENLSIRELREKRYADYQGKPSQWTVRRILHAYFQSPAPLPATDDAFYSELARDEVRASLCRFTSKFAPSLKGK